MPNFPSTISFNNSTLRVVNHNQQPWLSAADLATALGYSRTDSVSRLYRKNADEFTDGMTAIINLNTAKSLKTGNTDSVLNEDSNTIRVFSPRGCHLIAMFSRTKVAKDFRKWALDVLDGLGSKTKPSSKAKALPNGLSIDQQTVIKELVRERADKLPENLRAKATIRCWSSLKSKFGCTYKEISPADFTEAVSLVSRLPLEGEFIESSKPKMMMVDQDQMVHAKTLRRVAMHRWHELDKAIDTQQRVLTELTQIKRSMYDALAEGFGVWLNVPNDDETLNDILEYHKNRAH